MPSNYLEEQTPLRKAIDVWLCCKKYGSPNLYTHIDLWMQAAFIDGWEAALKFVTESVSCENEKTKAAPELCKR